MEGKQFDLVDYHTGHRVVIGRARLNSDGHIEAQISKLHKPEIMEILFSSAAEMQFSIGTNPAPPVATTVVARTTTTTTVTPT